MCAIRRELIAMRRSMRWVLDHNDSKSFPDCYQILSNIYETLRDIELQCLSVQNDRNNNICLMHRGD